MNHALVCVYAQTHNSVINKTIIILNLIVLIDLTIDLITITYYSYQHK